MFQIMGPLVSAFAHMGYLQPRMGSGIPYTVPRGTYRCADGVWVAISSSADTVATRVLALIGAAGDQRFLTFQDRARNREALEELVRAWVGARSSAEVIREFRRVDAAIAPVKNMRDIFADEHIRARGVITEVDGITMQNVVARMSKTPGAIRHAGRPFGADTDEVLAELKKPAAKKSKKQA
jgi:crotonobetainyl-CoA:carnitine CoA-transferase CaiB-like acyl-CoA transferase